MPKPDLTLLFGGDVTDWDRYLARHFEDFLVHHEQVEEILFPLPSCSASVISESRVVLVILSPQFLAFLEGHPEEFFQLTKLLKPGKTLAVLCGVKPDDVKYFHKAALVSYDDWRRLVISTDKDVNMVRNVIETVQEMLARAKENERINKPRFKLVPRKVQEGNGKVYVMMAKPLDVNVKVRVCLGIAGMKEVLVKKRNPYTLMFVVPDDCMNQQSLLNVHIWCGEDLLGVGQVKCESKMGELFNLLSSVESPYEFLCNTLGVATLHDVDEYLAAAFRKNKPKSGFDLLQLEPNYERQKSKEEFPTLLHFASRHGLCQLVKELLQCPGAEVAYLLKNGRLLTPAQLANHAGHNNVAAIIDEYQVSLHLRNQENRETSPVACNKMNAKANTTPAEDPTDCYDIPSYPVPVSPTPAPAVEEKECEYMKMHSYQKENIEPLQNKFPSTQDKRDFLNDILPLYGSNKNLSKDTSQNEKTKLTLLESQTKLIEIMEAYKKGASLTEVERLHNEWKAVYQVTDIEAKSTLEGLRNLYAKAQKAKLNKKHSTSFSELRQFLHSKLRRKDSIGSKGSLSRKNSKDMTSMDRLNAESDANRPISTLSVLSNTSSSSGSSFDRLSTASAGSDSGHHSDISEDHSLKKKDLKHSLDSTPCWLTNSTSPKNILIGPFSGKPPAPPPRPTKPVSRYAAVGKPGEPQYSVSRKSATLPKIEAFPKDVEYIQPDSNNYNGNDGSQKTSVSKKDFSFLEDPNANYDCPPPPRPSFRPRTFSESSSNNPQLDYDLVPPPRTNGFSDSKSPHLRNLPATPPDFMVDYDLVPSPRPSCCADRRNTPTSPRSPKMDYDLVPPPLPLSSPPIRTDSSMEETYDVLNPNVPRRVRSSSVSSSYDFPRSPLTLCQTSKDSSVSKDTKLPSIPSFDIITEKDSNGIPKVYHNLCYKPPRGESDQRDSIPEEMAPPPPMGEFLPEEHYKMVGLPVPVTHSFIKTS